jgi:nicotinamide-nucleotide amidase
MKERWASVDPVTLEREGPVSEPVARQMAEGARRAAGSTWGLSVTGFAGPGGGTEATPVGTVYLGLAGPSGAQVRKAFFPADRDFIRQWSAYMALDMLRLALIGESR